MNQWIRRYFFRTKRAKCLILIGPTGIGKTSFALSLPGRVNYFKGRWNLDAWNDYARYSVYDDIPWDQFQTLNYPNKKDLLTQNGKTHVS
jgi:energy-coupling factor transporter ATP-binding protein EcfA2